MAPARYGWMRDQLHELFRDAFGDAGGRGFVPAVGVTETPRTVTITIDLRWLSEDAVSVRRTGSRVAIEARWEQEEDRQDRRHHVHETRRCSFERRFRIPEGLDPESLATDYERGLLTLTLRKLEEPAAGASG